MATKNINTRIKLKIDTLENWQSSTIGLLKGELAIATVAATAGTGLTEPVVMIKIGEDGTKTFKDLPWNFYAKASDVISACKSESDLTTFVNNVIASAGIATDEALSTLASRVTTTENNITALQGLVGSTAVATQIQNAIDALKLSDTYEAKGSADAAKTAVIGTAQDTSDASTIYGAKAYAKAQADSKDSAIAAAKKAGDDAQADVDTLSAKVGTVTDGKTVVEMIADAQTAATYDDTALSGRVTTVENKVTTLVGDDSGKSTRTIASEEVAKIVADAPEAYDTLKEISDWISSHTSDASAMNSAILALQAIVDGIGGDGEKATVVEYVTDAINALNIGDYAKAADLTALAARVSTLEDTSHTHTNKTVLDGITSDKITSWDTAATNNHTHDNKTVLDGITSEKVSSWDTAVTLAGTALQEITTTADGGLKVTNKNQIDIDDSITFILDCGTASV